jgi:hypothetical protein
MPTSGLLFILYYRAGSHLLLKCLAGRPGNELIDGISGVYAPSNLLVTGPKITIQHLIGDVRDLDPKPNPSQCRYVYVADWWGGVSTHHQVPDPYDGETLSRWGYEELRPLLDNWKVVYLLRDPRSHIESLRCTTGEKKNPYQVRDSLDYFTYQCKAARNRMRVALDSVASSSNVITLKSEELISCPSRFFSQLVAFSGMSLDVKAILETHKADTLTAAGDFHSTFKSVSGYENRWSNWTSEEISIFNDTAGAEARELGYSRLA